MLERGLDQAAGLRRLVAPAAPRLLALPVSGRGREAWIAHLAHALAAAGRKPLVIDAARGSVTAAFGLRPRRDLIDLLEGEGAFDDIATCTADGVHVLRADAGVEAFVASGAPASHLLGGFARLSHGFSDLLLAMPASEIACLAAPGACVPVVGLDETPLAAYEVVKTLAQDFGFRRFACIAPRDDGPQAAREAHARLAGAALRFLGARVAWAGTPNAAASGLLDAAAHSSLH